jgi:hypothetical protein
LDVADMLLGLPRERLIDIGTKAAAYARQHFNAVKVYHDIIAALRQQFFAAE